MVLTTIAGMAGISFAVFVLQILEKAANDPGVIKTHYQVSFGLAIGTCILLIALGVLAGLAPAYRAMAIKPIEAIRMNKLIERPLTVSHEIMAISIVNN